MNNITIYSSEKPMPNEMISRLFEIIEYSFPRDERRDLEDLFYEFHKPHFHSLVQEESGGIAGFMNYWQFENFVYLEHFAVARDLRGRGIGAQLMEKFCGVTNCPVILEVEPPELSKTASHRIAFYKRLGFFLNEFEYYQPPYHKGDNPLRLMIMSKPSSISMEQFTEMRDTIYHIVYETNGDFV